MNVVPFNLPQQEPLVGDEDHDSADYTFIRLHSKEGVWMQMSPLISSVVKVLLAEQYINVRCYCYLSHL